jgi:hypothetical protein
MDNRTIQIFGQGYGPEPVTITAKANGNVVFSGAVTTLNETIPPRNTIVPQLLYSFEIDRSFSGVIPMTCEVSSGTALLATVKANYMLAPNPAYTSAQLDVLADPNSTDDELYAVYSVGANPPFTQSETDTLYDLDVPESEKDAIFVAHNCTALVATGVDGFAELPSDPNSSVILYQDGQSTPLYPDHEEAPGTWSWTVSQDEELRYNLTVPPAV